MKSNQLWTAASKAMAVVTVMLIVTLLLASGAAAASKFKVLHAFTWARSPWAKLILDPAGNLYGTTSVGSNNNSIVFEITPQLASS